MGQANSPSCIRDDKLWKSTFHGHFSFSGKKDCQRPSSDCFRHPLALELPESRASLHLRCIQWGRHRPVLCTFFLAPGSLLLSSETSVVSVKREQVELLLPVCPTVLYVRLTVRLAELRAIQPSLPSPCQGGF